MTGPAPTPLSLVRAPEQSVPALLPEDLKKLLGGVAYLESNRPLGAIRGDSESRERFVKDLWARCHSFGVKAVTNAFVSYVQTSATQHFPTIEQIHAKCSAANPQFYTPEENRPPINDAALSILNSLEQAALEIGATTGVGIRQEAPLDVDAFFDWSNKQPGVPPTLLLPVHISSEDGWKLLSAQISLALELERRYGSVCQGFEDLHQAYLIHGRASFAFEEGSDEAEGAVEEAIQLLNSVEGL